MAVTLKFLAEAATAVTDAAITELNFGNIIRGNSKIMGLKIGNTGSSIAESVTLSIEGADESVAWKTLSIDAGVTYGTTQSLANIAATTGLSSAIKVKSTVPAGATTGVHTCNLRCEYVYV